MEGVSSALEDRRRGVKKGEYSRALTAYEWEIVQGSISNGMLLMQKKLSLLKLIGLNVDRLSFVGAHLNACLRGVI